VTHLKQQKLISSTQIRGSIRSSYYLQHDATLLEPVERAAFFGECTLAGLRECINQPAYCTPADNALQQIRDRFSDRSCLRRGYLFACQISMMYLNPRLR